MDRLRPTVAACLMSFLLGGLRAFATVFKCCGRQLKIDQKPKNIKGDTACFIELHPLLG